MIRNRVIEFLAPFQVRSFRFQFPADLLTSWAGEMEVLILGWYILTASGSVMMLTVYGAIQWLGTIVAPVFGLAGDRWGHRNILSAMRAVYGAMAAITSTLALTGLVTPIAVLLVASVVGMIRPSDLAMRSALVAETIPGDRLMAASGVARTTVDSARVFGALAGAALFAWLGMGPAYVAITICYAGGFMLTLGVGAPRSAHNSIVQIALWRDLREGMTYIWDSPASKAGVLLAFLVNLTAFPLTLGLMPYVAREIYHVDQTGLGTLSASFAFGALMGSIAISFIGRALLPARMTVACALVWYALLLFFIYLPTIGLGRVALVAAGFAQSFSMVPLAVMLLHGAGPRFRGRVMGVRMLAIYGLPLGLLMAGGLIERFGFRAIATVYVLSGIGLTVVILLRWYAALWPKDAAANAR